MYCQKQDQQLPRDRAGSGNKNLQVGRVCFRTDVFISFIMAIVSWV